MKSSLFKLKMSDQESRKSSYGPLVETISTIVEKIINLEQN